MLLHIGPKDGNDESTIVELGSGEVLYITRSNTSPCRAGKLSNNPASRCLEFALSTDGGTSFSAVGNETVNNQLAGPPTAVSALAVVEHNQNRSLSLSLSRARAVCVCVCVCVSRLILSLSVSDFHSVLFYVPSVCASTTQCAQLLQDKLESMRRVDWWLGLRHQRVYG